MERYDITGVDFSEVQEAIDLAEDKHGRSRDYFAYTQKAHEIQKTWLEKLHGERVAPAEVRVRDHDFELYTYELTLKD